MKLDSGFQKLKGGMIKQLWGFHEGYFGGGKGLLKANLFIRDFCEIG